MAGRKVKRTAAGRIFDPTRLRVLLPVLGLVWVLGKLFGWTSYATDTMVVVVVFGLTWDWVRDISGRLEAIERRLDEQVEKERIEQLASVGRDAQGRFSKQQPTE